MPAAESTDNGDTNKAGELSAYLMVRYVGGKKARWKRKYAVLRQDAIYLSDEKVVPAPSGTRMFHHTASTTAQRAVLNTESKVHSCLRVKSTLVENTVHQSRYYEKLRDELLVYKQYQATFNGNNLDSIPDDTAELRLPEIFDSCGPYSDKKAKKKHGFVLEPADAEEHEQWYFACDDKEQQQKWISAINDVIAGKKVQKAVSCPEFDEIIVQSTTLQHLAKNRPKYHGRRLPAKRPRSENALNGIPENADAKSDTPDSSQPNSPARDLSANGASTSAPASPANQGIRASPVVKRREGRKKTAFLKGISARVSRIFNPQPPRSPTSPSRLDSGSPQLRVPNIVTTDTPDGKDITRVEEEEEDIPNVVTKEDIVKMLDFLSETTELVVYKAVGLRGAVSSVDEAQSNEEMRNTWRALRKALKSLKGTMDSMTRAEEILKTATEITKAATTSAENNVPATAHTAATPLVADEKISAAKVKDASADKDPEKTEYVVKSKELGSLESVEDFDERKPSMSLMDSIQKTLNSEHPAAESEKTSQKNVDAAENSRPNAISGQTLEEPELKVKGEPMEEEKKENLVEKETEDQIEEEKKDPIKKEKKDPAEEEKKDSIEEKKDPIEEEKKDPIEEEKKDPIEEKKEPMTEEKEDGVNDKPSKEDEEKQMKEDTTEESSAVKIQDEADNSESMDTGK